MAKGRRGLDEADDLNLAPIMNLVVILIPMLLLSIVFLQVGVINITAPKLSVGPPSEPQEQPDKPPLNLTIAVNAKGFRIAAEGGTLPENPGCPVPGPTICLSNEKVDVQDKIDQARKLMAAGDIGAGESLLGEAMAAYNWISLYNMLSQIKKKFPDEHVVNLSADPTIPYAFMVRVMDVVRFKLEKEKYSKPSEFWLAGYKTKGKQNQELFPDPVLSVVQ